MFPDVTTPVFQRLQRPCEIGDIHNAVKLAFKPPAQPVRRPVRRRFKLRAAWR